MATKFKKEIIEACRKNLLEQRTEINEARKHDLSELKKAHETLTNTINTMQGDLSAIQVTVSASQGSLSMSQSTISATQSRMQQTVSDMQATTAAVQATISGLQTTIATSQDFRSAVQETLSSMQATQSAIQETLSSMRVTQSAVQETLSSMQETLPGFFGFPTSSPVYPTLQPVDSDSLASHSASTRSESTVDVQPRVTSDRPPAGPVSTDLTTTLAMSEEFTGENEDKSERFDVGDAFDDQDIVEENSRPEAGFVNARRAMCKYLSDILAEQTQK